MSASGLLLAHAFTLLAWALFVRREVRLSAAMVAADGGADTLPQGFHRCRISIRALAAGVLAVSGPLPAWEAWPRTSRSALALLLVAGYCMRTLNPALNRARGFDYTTCFYVAPFQHAAAFPDRCSWHTVNSSNPG